MLIISNSLRIDYNQALNELLEQIAIKNHYSQVSEYIPLTPPLRSAILVWDQFKLEEYDVGDKPRGFSVDEGYGRVVVDPNDPGNLVFEVSAGDNGASIMVGVPSANNFVMQARVRGVVSGEVANDSRFYGHEICDGKWHTLVQIGDNAGSHVLMDGEKVHLSQERILFGSASGLV